MPRLCLLLLLMLPPAGLAQLTGTFSLDKSTFAPGEPVVLSFTVRNDGKQAEAIEIADPYSFCSGYTIHITRDGSPKDACFQNSGGSCLSMAPSLAPGESHTERLLLNYQDLSRGDLSPPVLQPGSYTIDASRTLAHSPAINAMLAPDLGQNDQIHEVFRLRIDDSLEPPPAVYEPYLQQLSSKDEQLRGEAARTLATLAPASLEPLLLTFATSKDRQLSQFAPLALATLGTKASIAALAEMLLHTEPGTYEFVTAADKLGKAHDPAWFPLLLAIADKQGGMYLDDAAQAGGEAAIPALLTRLHTPNASDRSQAIYALGETGSRAAVPILIAMLAGPLNQEGDARQAAITADAALMQLTHLYAEQGSDGALIAGWHQRWQRWWLAAGSTAPIYKPGDCVTETPLP